MFFAFYLPIGSFLLASTVLLVYIFWPFSVYSVALPSTQQAQVFVIAHGLKDNDKTWSQQLKSKLKSKHPSADVISIDWSTYADNAFTCAVNGRRIGHEIAHSLVANQALAGVQVIGHSCGGFVNLGICEQVKAHNDDIEVTSVYLDPVSVYGGIFWNFGTEHFGECSDNSVTYFDTQDQVPGSNRSPVHSKGMDITNLKQEYSYQGTPHHWPIYYYIHQLN